MRSCELMIQIGGHPDLRAAQFLPTVCLLVLPLGQNTAQIDLLIRDCLSLGTEFFSVWGEGSDAVEDEIDAVLEGLNKSHSHIPTTSHMDESPEDVANFVINAAYLEDTRFRVLVIVDKLTPEVNTIIMWLQKLCAERT